MATKAQVDQASRRGPVSILLRAASCVLAGIILLVALSELRKAGTAGAPIAWVYVSIAVAAVTFLVQIPAAYYRLPRAGRVTAATMLLVSMFFIGIESSQMEQSWSSTPQGKREAADAEKGDRERQVRAAADNRAAAEQASREKQAEQVADSQRKAEQFDKDLDACFSYFGHNIPKLTEQVKASLENPAAFEHVGTQKIGDLTSPYNIAMTFRAQNGYGAIRTASVRAKVNPADCSVEDVGEITD